MKAERLATQCPICNESIGQAIGDHLYDHSKSDLVDELLGYMESEQQSEKQ